MLNYRKQAAQYAKPFQMAGLEYLLIEDAARLAELKKAKTQAKVFYQSSLPKSDIKKNLQSSPRSSEEAKERAVEKSTNIPILKEYEWPEAWIELWTKIARHNAPKIAWTYTGLHDDIVGNDSKNPQRQEIIRHFITGLKSPNGTHIIVPYDKPNDAGKLFTNEDKTFYWSAIARLNVRHLFVFGQKASDELLLPQKPIHTVIPFQGYRVYILPDINKLIGNMADVKAMLEYLKIQLSSVKI